MIIYIGGYEFLPCMRVDYALPKRGLAGRQKYSNFIPIHYQWSFFQGFWQSMAGNVLACRTPCKWEWQNFSNK